MGKVVRVKRLDDGKVIEMAEANAQRLTSVDKNFIILENPIVEVVTLPPVQKKSVEVVESKLTDKAGLTNTKLDELIDSGQINLTKPADIGNVPPRLATEQPAPVTQTTQDVIKPRMGRPPKNQS